MTDIEIKMIKAELNKLAKQDEFSNIHECTLKLINLYEAIILGNQMEIEQLKKNTLVWHKVADGDLPKVGQKCYFIYSNFYGEDNKVIFSESSIKVLTGVYTFILDEETDDETTETCFYDDINDEEIYEQEVYAWKEIVLPQDIKENDTTL